MHKYETMSFRKYTFRSELDKAINTLEGILKGISIDNIVNTSEITELVNWCNVHREFINTHPFNEIIPIIESALGDNILDEDEIQDMLWVCQSISSENMFFDITTADIQKLHGILHGILSDNIITAEEIRGLEQWLDENEHLRMTYPYDEIYSLVTHVLADGVVDKDEANLLKVFFSEFINIDKMETINLEELYNLKQSVNINGICMVCPEILIQDKIFCFTGISSRTKRSVIADTIESMGGIFRNNVSSLTNYLVVGNNNNPCWSFSCYGRKVEKAMELRKKGHNILIVHENDFWDTLEDYKNSVS
jgi:NAD-dependent DNA ligase